MHRPIATLLFIAVLLIVSGTVSPVMGYFPPQIQPPGIIVTVTAPTVNLRSGPGTNYAVVGSANQGASLTVLGRNEQTTWLQVRTPNQTTGWVFAQLVALDPAIGSVPVVTQVVAPVVTQAPAPTTSGKSCTVTSATANVRSGPGTTYQVVTFVTQGAVLAILDKSAASDWLYIRTPNNVSGWVSAGLCGQGQGPVGVAPSPSLPSYVGSPFKPNTTTGGDAWIYECFGSGDTPLRQVAANTPIQSLGTGTLQTTASEAQKLGAPPHVKIRLWDGQFAWIPAENVSAGTQGLPRLAGNCEDYDRINWSAIVKPTPIPAPVSAPSSGGGSSRSCCKICSAGKACGNSCISRRYTCHQPPGCACDG